MDIERIFKYAPWRVRHYARCLCGYYGQGLWKFIPNLGYEVVVPWPKDVNTADPNDIMRSWLEEEVGKQGIHWSWWAYHENYDDRLKVQFLKKNDALMFKLMYG